MEPYSMKEVLDCLAFIGVFVACALGATIIMICVWRKFIEWYWVIRTYEEARLNKFVKHYNIPSTAFHVLRRKNTARTAEISLVERQKVAR